MSRDQGDSGSRIFSRHRGHALNLSSFFNWSIGEGLCESNPVDKTNRNDENTCERVLANNELKTIWRALPDNEFGKCAKLLMLTSQRRNEIGGLRVVEFNKEKRQIELPPERTKNGLPHIVPLSDMAMKILESVLRATFIAIRRCKQDDAALSRRNGV